MRKTLEPTQWLGATLGVIGQRRVNPKTGEVQHKAKEVAVLSPPADLPPLMVATRPLPSTEVPEAMASVPPSMSATSSPATDRPAANPSSKKPATILVCNKSKCCKRGGHEVIEQLEQELSDRQLTDQVKIRRTGCMKQCKAGPNLVMPDKTRYSRIQAGDVPDLVEKHF
ncbi:MAG: NAD(P)H-dependent oxidoreductase subunit E [Elainellaceae cyanobacterium]